MKIEAGKFYRTRSGDKAFVSAVGLKCPFGEAAVPYPVTGFIETRIGLKTWTLEGRAFTVAEDSCDLVAEWEDKPAFRPFRNAQEFLTLRDFWVHLKDQPNDRFRVVRFNDSGVWLPCRVNNGNGFLGWEELFARFEFNKDSPCGVRIR